MFIKKTGTISIDVFTPSNEEDDKNIETNKTQVSNGKTQQKVEKYYLPVLYLNRAEEWQPAPNDQRRHFTDEVAMETCLSKCCGHEGLKSACCTLDPDDLEHILGPLDETWIKKTVSWFRKKGINVTRHDLVIDYEEGKLIGSNHFNGHKVFEQKASYPMLRIQVYGPRWACKFLNVNTGMCTIYDKRPDMCRDYLCQYVKSNFLVRTKTKPNTYQNVRRKQKHALESEE
jgi:Fe-S-cluster containining protein